MSLPIDLEGKVALVSGVTSGIGAAIANVLAHAGCSVAGCGKSGHDSAGAKSFKQSMERLGRKCHYSEVDLSIRTEAEQWIDEAAHNMGSIDILVSNAGKNIFRGAENCRNSDWDECMELDLASHWRCAKAAKKWLDLQESSTIIMITSNHAWNTMPNCFPYNVAKAGLLGMVQSLAIEWGPRTRTIGIAPGFIDTTGNQAWFDNFPHPDEERKRTEYLHPVKRIGTPDEVGYLCAFLASPLAAFITGTTICVDGGRSALLQDEAINK